MQTCGSKTRSNETCKNRAMSNGRCRMHGGKSLVGLGSPSFVDGKYSKFIPARLTARYGEALADTALLELKEEVALLDARLSDVLGRVDTGESGKLWETAQKALMQYKVTHKRDEVKAALALMDLEDAILAGTSDYTAWGEIATIIEQRRRLVESERKRLVEMQQMITTEQAMALLAMVVDTVRRHVPDRAALAAISAELVQLTARTGGGTIESSDG